MPRKGLVTVQSARLEGEEPLGTAPNRGISPESSRPTSVMAEEIKDDDEHESDEHGDLFMVHDSALYTEVLDASDWTEVLKREKRRKKREALAQHSVEEANERDRRDALRKKAAEDAKAVKEAQKKILCAAREERETAAFRERNDDFFVRHNALLNQWDPIERTNQNYRDRVREQIYRRWEKEVFLPLQKEINQKVKAKCSSDSRPHLFNKRAKESDHRKASNETNSRNEVPWTWKEKKDELWKSFLNESNRKSKIGGRGGLFLDVIDEVEYDPIAQRKADTIRYKKRTLPTSDADQHRVEAQKLELQYSVLGLAYRDQERKSCTGILRETEGKTSNGPLTDLRSTSPVSTRHTRVDTPSVVCRSGSAEEGYEAGPHQYPPALPVYHVQNHVEHNIPHTHVPYEFARQFHCRIASPNGTSATGYGPSVTGPQQGVERHGPSPSPRQSRAHSTVLPAAVDGENGANVGTPVGSYAGLKNTTTSGPAHLQPQSVSVDRSLALASITGEGFAAKTIKTMDSEWRDRVVQRKTEERRRQLEDRHLSPLAIIAQQKRGEQNILECDRLVMPLPLKPTPAPPTERSKHLLPWMCPTGTSKGPINERAHYLPVNQWGKAQLHESVYGHYVHPDGSLRPPLENKQEGGWRIHDSNVSFDHFHFPKENESMHTGKRMCVYYQK